MNILHIIHNLRREGAQIVLRNLATHTTIHRQHVFAWKLGGVLERELENAGVTVIVPNSPRGISTPRAILNDLSKAIRQYNIDILHAHLPDSALWGALASRRCHIPLVTTYHSNQLVPPASTLSRLLHYFALQFAARGTSHHIAVSESVRDQVIKTLHVTPDKVSVIPNGISIPEHPSTTAQAETTPHIVTVGRLVDIKAHEQLLMALPTVMEHWPQTHCTVVGDGPRRASLEAITQDLGITEHVTFVGATHDVTRYLRQATLYVSTSQFEGIPMSILEAMAWGLPVIASDVPGNSDIVKHEVTGLLYPWGRGMQLSNAILYMTQHPQQAFAMAKVARAGVISSYSLEAMSGRYAELYEQMNVA